MSRTANTLKEVASTLGVSAGRVFRLKKSHGYGKVGNCYDVERAAEILREKADNFLTKTKLSTDDNKSAMKEKPLPGDLRDHEIRYRKARADIEESKAATLKGSLIDITEVRQEQTTREMAFKKAFMNLPKNMATRLVGCGSKEIEAVLTKYVSEAFRKLINNLKTSAL